MMTHLGQRTKRIRYQGQEEENHNHWYLVHCLIIGVSPLFVIFKLMKTSKLDNLVKKCYGGGALFEIVQVS